MRWGTRWALDSLSKCGIWALMLLIACVLLSFLVLEWRFITWVFGWFG